jgi:5-methylcytosine-specific restriction endonuclease McrA
MVFMGKVEVVDQYDHDIRSVSIVIKAPAVVRLLQFVKIGIKAPPLCRSNIFARDHYRCQYCGDELSPKEATLDHVIPRSQGGKTSWENVVCCCSDCNREKGGRTPREARMHLLKKPEKPHWLPVLHIRLNGKVPTSWHIFLSAESARHKAK